MISGYCEITTDHVITIDVAIATGIGGSFATLLRINAKTRKKETAKSEIANSR